MTTHTKPISSRAFAGRTLGVFLTVFGRCVLTELAGSGTPMDTRAERCSTLRVSTASRRRRTFSAPVTLSLLGYECVFESCVGASQAVAVPDWFSTFALHAGSIAMVSGITTLGTVNSSIARSLQTQPRRRSPANEAR
jgi:hypothetical protein